MARDVTTAGSPSSSWVSNVGTGGVKPAAVTDSLAAPPRAVSDNVASTAPVAVIGSDHTTPQANAVLVTAPNVPRAVRHVAPLRVIRSSSNDVEHPTAAASNAFAVD